MLDERGPDPRGPGIGRGEHLRRPGSAAAVGGGGRGARGARVPRRQHPGLDGRLPLAALRPIRLGCSTIGRPGQLCRRPGDRGAGGGMRAGRWADRRRVRCGPGAADAARHPSPNAGVVEAAFAGALGVRLGGPTQYHHELQIRPTLGDGRHPRWPICAVRCCCRGRCRLAAAAALSGFARRPSGPLIRPRRIEPIGDRCRP